jgi:hypothetical protein
MDDENPAKSRPGLRGMWPDLRLGVIVGAIAVVLGPAAALLTSTPPTTLGNTAHKAAVARPPIGRLATGDHEVVRNDHVEDDRN